MSEKEQLKQAVIQTLNESGQFKPEEREAIASAIETAIRVFWDQTSLDFENDLAERRAKNQELPDRSQREPVH